MYILPAKALFLGDPVKYKQNLTYIQTLFVCFYIVNITTCNYFTGFTLWDSRQNNQTNETHFMLTFKQFLTTKSIIISRGKLIGLFSILKLPSELVLPFTTTSPSRWSLWDILSLTGQANSVAWEMGKPKLGYSRLQRKMMVSSSPC